MRPRANGGSASREEAQPILPRVHANTQITNVKPYRSQDGFPPETLYVAELFGQEVPPYISLEQYSVNVEGFSESTQTPPKTQVMRRTFVTQIR